MSLAAEPLSEFFCVRALGEGEDKHVGGGRPH